MKSIDRQLLVELDCLAREYAVKAESFQREFGPSINNVLDAADVVEEGHVPDSITTIIDRACRLAGVDRKAFGVGMTFGSLVTVASLRLRFEEQDAKEEKVTES